MTTDVPVQQREAYRERMNRSIGVSVIGFAAASIATAFAPDELTTPILFLGLGVAYLGFFGYFLVWYRTGVRLLDEREERIEHRSSQIVAFVLTVVVWFGLPADVVLEVTGVVDVPTAVRGAIWGYFVLGLVWLAVYGYVERQHS